MAWHGDWKDDPRPGDTFALPAGQGTVAGTDWERLISLPTAAPGGVGSITLHNTGSTRLLLCSTWVGNTGINGEIELYPGEARTLAFSPLHNHWKIGGMSPEGAGSLRIDALSPSGGSAGTGTMGMVYGGDWPDQPQGSVFDLRSTREGGDNLFWFRASQQRGSGYIEVRNTGHEAVKLSGYFVVAPVDGKPTQTSSLFGQDILQVGERRRYSFDTSRRAYAVRAEAVAPSDDDEEFGWAGQLALESYSLMDGDAGTNGLGLLEPRAVHTAQPGEEYSAPIQPRLELFELAQADGDDGAQLGFVVIGNVGPNPMRLTPRSFAFYWGSEVIPPGQVRTYSFDKQGTTQPWKIYGEGVGGAARVIVLANSPNSAGLDLREIGSLTGGMDVVTVWRGSIPATVGAERPVRMGGWNDSFTLPRAPAGSWGSVTLLNFGPNPAMLTSSGIHDGGNRGNDQVVSDVLQPGASRTYAFDGTADWIIQSQGIIGSTALRVTELVKRDAPHDFHLNGLAMAASLKCPALAARGARVLALGSWEEPIYLRDAVSYSTPDGWIKLSNDGAYPVLLTAMRTFHKDCTWDPDALTQDLPRPTELFDVLLPTETRTYRYARLQPRVPPTLDPHWHLVASSPLGLSQLLVVDTNTHNIPITESPVDWLGMGGSKESHLDAVLAAYNDWVATHDLATGKPGTRDVWLSLEQTWTATSPLARAAQEVIHGGRTGTAAVDALVQAGYPRDEATVAVEAITAVLEHRSSADAEFQQGAAQFSLTLRRIRGQDTQQEELQWAIGYAEHLAGRMAFLRAAAVFVLPVWGWSRASRDTKALFVKSAVRFYTDDAGRAFSLFKLDLKLADSALDTLVAIGQEVDTFLGYLKRILRAVR